MSWKNGQHHGPSRGGGSFNQVPDKELTKKLWKLAWHYKWGCFRILSVQLVLLAMSIFGLGLMGLGIDYIRYELGKDKKIEIRQSADTPALHHTAKPPQWPLGIKPPETWTRMQVLFAIGGGILLLAFARSFFTFLNAAVSTRLLQGQFVVDFRSKIYEKMQQLSFKFFDANTSGSLINRIQDVQRMRAFIDGVAINGAILILTLISYLVYMIRINGMLTAACLASTPLLWVLTRTFSKTVRPAYRKNRDLFDKVILALSENVQGVHVVKGFARQKQENEKFAVINATYRDQQFWIFNKIAIFQPLISFLTQFNLIVMLGFGSYLVIQYEMAPDPASAAAVGISVGQLLIFAGLLQQFSGQISGLSDIANRVQMSSISAQRVFEVIDAEPEIKTPCKPIRITNCKGQVEFFHVNFSYKKDEEPVLKDVHFKIQPGQVAAIVGQTASGKTTLLSLIPRFYDPDAGCIMLDGVDLRQLDVNELRRQIGVVFQESFLFSNTVAANIAYGQPYATQEQIEKAAKIACAHDFIMQMPKGYDTILHEGGIDLSGGQRQRIAIARAILLEPKILLLDDPTAAVDSETEKEIIQALQNAMEGRTTFVVSHRLSTLKRANKVIVLKEGKIIQTGTHDELMKTDGHYSIAATLQMPDEESLRLLADPVIMR